MKQGTRIIQGDCGKWLRSTKTSVDLTFFDPPFNQGRFYRHFDDKQKEDSYWNWITETLTAIRKKTSPGGAIYFMHREKNTEYVLAALRHTGWTFQNLIIWKKMTSAVPCKHRFGKHYQIIVLATNGKNARTFNKLRIDPPLMPHHKQARENGVYVTDVWDDIRELTSGYFAGDEPMRTRDGERFHKQQAPTALLLRIILSSSNKGDVILDPCAGTGTTMVVAEQLERRSVGIEIDPQNIECIKDRLNDSRQSDHMDRLFHYYRHTGDIEIIWGRKKQIKPQQKNTHSTDDSLRIPSFL